MENKINRIVKSSNLLTIILCIGFIFITRNLIYLAVTFIFLDAISYGITKLILKKYIFSLDETSFNAYDEYKVKGEDIKELIRKLQRERINIEKEKKEKEAEEIKKVNEAVKETFKDDIAELKEINQNLVNTLKKSSLEFPKKEIKNMMKEIEDIANLHPYKLNGFFNKYSLYAKELLNLLLQYENSANKKEYEESTVKLLNEFSKYLNTSLGRLKNEEKVGIESSLKVLLKELEKENAK